MPEGHTSAVDVKTGASGRLPRRLLLICAPFSKRTQCPQIAEETITGPCKTQ